MKISKKLYRKSILQKVRDFVTYVYFLHYPYDEISLSYEMNTDKDITHIRIQPLGFIIVLSWLARLDISQVYIVEHKENRWDLKGCLYSICDNLQVLKVDEGCVVYSLNRKYYIHLISKLLRFGFLDQFPVELYNLFIFRTQNKKFYKSIGDLMEGNISPFEYMHVHEEGLDFIIYIHDDDIFHLFIREDKLNDLGFKFYLEQYMNEMNLIDKQHRL